MNRNQNDFEQSLAEIETENFDMEEYYQSEIDRLLEARPEMVDFQREIERRLAHAGNFQNRMAVLSIMMEDKLKQLQIHMNDLADIVRQKALTE